MTKENIIRQAYEAAVERYAAVGVDVREAMDKLQKISLSMHCWQESTKYSKAAKAVSLVWDFWSERWILQRRIILWRS